MSKSTSYAACALLTAVVLGAAAFILQRQGLAWAEQAAVHGLLIFYGLALCILWARHQRVRPYMLPASTGHSPSIAALSGMDMHSELSDVLPGPRQQHLAQAVVQERHRIAQDIHDGVGSQLVGLLASLDPALPAHRRIMLGLESCLLDLKNTVDNVDATDESDTNIFDALGRLRYRIQPSLDRVGIRMHWKVDVAGPLMAVKASQLQHLVRIVQESLANVLLHSEAADVQLRCSYQELPAPHMVLEILDNGNGMVHSTAPAVAGKGLSGMKERAGRIGAQLQISSKQGLGTRVRLKLALA
jgi:signal transduction histidine kinase